VPVGKSTFTFKLEKQLMAHQKDLQVKLHETRGKILQLEFQIEDLMKNRQANQAKIEQIQSQIKELKSSL